MIATQIDLFGEATEQASAPATVLVRSHLRVTRGAGDPASSAKRKDAARVVVPPRMPPLAVPAPHNGTDTSKSASLSVTASGGAQADRVRVLECIRAAGARGITRADIIAQTGLSGDTVRPRVWELLGSDKRRTEAAQVEEPGQKRVPDCGGRLAQTVVVAKEAGE